MEALQDEVDDPPDSTPLMGEGVEGTREKGRVRNLASFWLLGMCNNFGYVVMLSAAHDLLSQAHSNVETPTPRDTGGRHCNPTSTATILLADILPSVAIKLVSPFFPLWIHFRVLLVVVLAIGGFLFVASCKGNIWYAVVGVILTSLSAGLGESSFLMYMPFFSDKNVVSTWSSGTGGAGVFGSASYLGLLALGVTPAVSIYSMISVPVFMAFAFWILMVRPDTKNPPPDPESDVATESHLTLKEKLSVGWKVFYIYMLPFGLVYLFEYFINQGLFELIFFKNLTIGTAVDASTQYRVYNFMYQVGVLVSRSSVNLFAVNNTWMLAILQGINVIIMTTEAIYLWLDLFWAVVILILWEGLLGGCSYVNTYRRINVEMPIETRQFAMSMNSFGDAIGITLAALIALPVHKAICAMPSPT